jgi:hypothetical protein
MYKFFTKASALVFTFLSASITFCAEKEPTSIGDVIVDITTARPATLSFSKCVLDFSDTRKIMASSAKIGVYLLAEKASNQLDLMDIAYITFEGIAAGSRANPSGFGKLAPYFTNEDAVYETFGRAMGGLTAAKQDLSILGNPASCTSFVQGTINRDLPKLLTQLGMPVSDQEDIKLLATVFTPMFAQLLNRTYAGALVASSAFATIIDDVEEKVSGCGCFPCFGGKAKKKA